MEEKWVQKPGRREGEEVAGNGRSEERQYLGGGNGVREGVFNISNNRAVNAHRKDSVNEEG